MLNLDDIRQAAKRIAPHAHRTPVLTSSYLDRETGCRLFFKCENFQKTGSFKFRGACNAVFSLSREEADRGVLTGSSGNHGQALVYAAGLRHVKATVVMPSNAPAVKVAAVKAYGAHVIFSDPDPSERLRAAEKVQSETGATLVHPFNDERVMRGQGTAALEAFDQVECPDVLLVPVGGGGLAAGSAVAATELSPDTRVIGIEPQQADDARRSLAEGHIVPSDNPNTVADGLRTSLGELTFPVLRDRLTSIVTVSEQGIVSAMRTLWERMKIVVEPSAAVPLAALLERRVDVKGRRFVLLLSGGNVDLDRLPWTGSEA